MTKIEALALIDEAKSGIINPVILLNWVWLRLFIVAHTDKEFDLYMRRVEDAQ